MRYTVYAWNIYGPNIGTDYLNWLCQSIYYIVDSVVAL